MEVKRQIHETWRVGNRRLTMSISNPQHVKVITAVHQLEGTIQTGVKAMKGGSLTPPGNSPFYNAFEPPINMVECT